ncbi:MAG: class I SAM-dependent methyltransferase [Bacteroidota bacterium]
MSLIASVLTRMRRLFASPLKETDPEAAYDLWAAGYDAQPENLMLFLDDALFTELLKPVTITGKRLLDIGCGTGRHWQKLLQLHPASLAGYDVSEQMLLVLKQKFPSQKTTRLTGHLLEEADNSCDLLVSTLTLAHIPDPAEALAEWTRVLTPGGDIIITDYHPGALEKGGNRTFRYNKQLVAVKNYVHSLEKLMAIVKQLDLTVVRIADRKVDASVKNWYQKQGALAVYEKFEGTPIIYGIHLKKKDAATQCFDTR